MRCCVCFGWRHRNTVRLINYFFLAQRKVKHGSSSHSAVLCMSERVHRVLLIPRPSPSRVSFNVNETERVIGDAPPPICCICGSVPTSPFTAFQPVSGLLDLNLFNLLPDSKDLNSRVCRQHPPHPPPPHPVSGSAPLMTEVTYCIRPSEEGYSVLVCNPLFSFRTSLGLPRLCSHSAASQPPSSIDPTISSSTFP